MIEPFVSDKVSWLAPNKLLRGLVALGAVLAVTGFGAAIALHLPPLAGFALYPLMGSVFGGLYVRLGNPKPRREDVALRVDERGIHSQKLEIPRHRIKDGFVLPRGGEHIVRLTRTGLDAQIELSAPDAETARGVLRALGLDTSQTVARFRVLSRAMAHRKKLTIAGALVGVLAGMMGPLMHATGRHAFMPIFGFLGVALFLSFLAIPTYLEVGVDGILLSWLGQKRFLRFEEVLDVARYTDKFGRSRTSGISITLQSAEVVKIPVGSSQWDQERLAIVEERIREALELHKSGGGDLDASVLHRGKRDVSGWIDNLRRLGVGANADARTAPIETERLLRIALDPAKKGTERAAAAIALGARADDDARARVREAAQATAAPKLRVALASATDATKEAELEAALAELEDEERERAKEESERRA